VSLQTRLEKAENSQLQDYIGLSFDMANLYVKQKWKYQDAQSLLQQIELKKQKRKEKTEAKMKDKIRRER
jgi:hypothetical protein